MLGFSVHAGEGDRVVVYLVLGGDRLVRVAIPVAECDQLERELAAARVLVSSRKSHAT
jgi:hypothetical protein